ncbi:lysine decarboxylase [Bacillus spizizenii]|nr:lysine decarboxylase [Bacillus spizizenii]
MKQPAECRGYHPLSSGYTDDHVGRKNYKKSVQKLSRLISMKTHVQGNMKIKEKQLLVYIEEGKS